MKRILTIITSLSIMMPMNAITQMDSIAINEVVVTGTRNQTDVRYLPLTITTINHRQIENRYEQSLLPLLTEQVPGMFVTSRGVMGYGMSTGASGGIKIRGIGDSPTTDILVLIDGHPQFMGLMGHSLTDAYQSFLAEKVEIVRGPSSVLYGSNAMGGVINIITRKSIANGIKNNIRIGAGSYGTVTTEYTGMMREGKLSAVIAGSYNRTDNQRSNMGFDQASGYTKMGYDLTRQWRLSADLNVTHFNSSNPGMVSNPKIDNDMHITRGMTSASIINDYGNTSGALTFFYNWGHHKINDGYEQGNTPKDYLFYSDDKMMGANWYQTANLFEGNRTTVGFDYQHIDGKAWNAYYNGTNTYQVDKGADEVAGYVDLKQTFVSILTFDAGLRFDHHSISGNQWIPQIGMSIQMPRNAEIRTMVSKGFRNPTLKDLYMFKSKNPDLSPISMMNYEISFHQNILEGRMKYGANVFYIDAKNMIETVMSNGTPQNQNTGAMKNWGIETELAYQFNRYFTTNANYSYLNTDKIVTAAPKHKLYVGADYDRGRWNVAGGVQWIYDLYTSTSSGDKENFTLVNLRISYRALNFLKLYAKGENLLAQSYEINKGFPMPRATFLGGVDFNF
jgi:outer membrane cobalamin receptor